MNNITNEDKLKSPPQTSNMLSWIPALSACVILLFFAIFLAKMFNYAVTVTEDEHWSRLLLLYNGLEAMAFAAAGVLLGERVQRSRAMAAENRADAAQDKADKAHQNAAEAKAKGKTLKAAVKAKTRSKGAMESAVAAPELAELSDLADRLFPD